MLLSPAKIARVWHYSLQHRRQSYSPRPRLTCNSVLYPIGEDIMVAVRSYKDLVFTFKTNDKKMAFDPSVAFYPTSTESRLVPPYLICLT